MIIKKLILKGYRRLFLNNINLLEYQPDKPMQIILGRNMSGKSQTLRQLNPLPANLKQEFYEDGSKTIEIEHNNKNYILVSSNGKHSFKLEDEELNPGGTRKVQLELVKDHFNITPDVIEILLNNTRLTTMSPSDRKKWISELSTIDYTYSISCYNKLRTRHRDITGAIKLLQDNIITNEANLINQEELKVLNKHKEILTEYNNYLISLYDHNLDYKTPGDIKELNHKLKILIAKSPRGDVVELQKQLYQIEGELGILRKERNTLLTKVEELDKISNIKDIQKYLDLYKQKQQAYENMLRLDTLNLGYEKAYSYYNSYSNVITPITAILNTLIEFDDVRLTSKEKREEYITNLDKVNVYITAMNNKINLYMQEIEHMNKHKSEDHITSCPKCSHQWYQGYDVNKIQELEKNIVSVKEKLEKYKSLKDKLEVTVERIKNMENLIQEFINILRGSIELKEVWNHLVKEFNIRTSSIQDILSVFNKYNSYLYKIKDLTDLQKEVSDLEKTIKTYEEIHNKYKNEQVDKLTEQLDKLYIVIKEKEEIFNVIKTNFNNLLEIRNIRDMLKEQLRCIKQHIDVKVKEERNKTLLEYSNSIKEEIVAIEHKIHLSNLAVSKLEQDKKTLEEYKNIEYVLSKMLTELSPTEGLIAKSISSFLAVFVQEMNMVIDKIWTYPVELSTCSITEDSDLDYKFKVTINNSETIEDISKLSSSVKEIVDLAFRIVFMKYMKLQEYPLYLDEFGATFDATHQKLAYDVIEKIMSSDFRQVFIICHFSSLYGNLQNCDFNVIDPNNIDLGTVTVYNQHMKIS